MLLYQFVSVFLGFFFGVRSIHWFLPNACFILTTYTYSIITNYLTTHGTINHSDVYISKVCLIFHNISTGKNSSEDKNECRLFLLHFKILTFLRHITFLPKDLQTICRQKKTPSILSQPIRSKLSFFFSSVEKHRIYNGLF